jgi:hypothetical protein
MSFDEFCHKLSTLDLGILDQALSLLWFYDEKTPDVRMTVGKLANLIKTTGLGNPNNTRLTEAIRKSGCVNQYADGYSLKPLARIKIRDQLKSILGATQPKIDQGLGFLPKPVWDNTRGYVEKICEQMNACFQFGYYDGAAVMARRLIETLIIEAYEHLGRAAEIKNNDGDYQMLAILVAAAISGAGLNLGRDTKKALPQIKELGDRSAHSRRFNANEPDLVKIQSGLRIAAEELINIANLRKAKPETEAK